MKLSLKCNSILSLLIFPVIDNDAKVKEPDYINVDAIISKIKNR
jgi:hypothetical protein